MPNATGVRIAVPADLADSAIRFAISNGSIKGSREVAEQALIDSVGGIGQGNLLNSLNPIGAARQGLKSISGYGEIEKIAVPNFLGNGGGAGVGGVIGGATNATEPPK